MASHFIPSHLDAILGIEDYRPGDYHPISVGGAFDHGRVRALREVGFRGSSTVRLARDWREDGDRGRIVTLKAMRTDVSSSKVQSEISELVISQNVGRLSLLPSPSIIISLSRV